MTTKEKIISALTTESDFISGEELAAKLNVSRAAIWKSVDALRNEGYDIEGVRNGGYRLVSLPDKLSAEKIENIIKARSVQPGKIICFEKTDSTNYQAKQCAILVGSFRDQTGTFTKSGAEYHRALFAAEEQTSGRGRMGRVFVSPKHSGVYFSLLYAPKNGLENPALFTAAAAVATCLSIDELYKTNSKIKWVNDIFLGNKKICGILTEGISSFETGKIEAAIVGIGINIKNGDFSEDVAKVAGSIEDFLTSEKKEIPPVSKNELVAHVVSHLLEFYDGFESKDGELLKKMMTEYQNRSILTGKTVHINPAAGMSGETYEAKVLGISENAELIVETPSGEKKILSSGEVSLHSFDFV